MSTVISDRELSTDSSGILGRLDQGETFIVTRNGQPVGRLVPLRKERFASRAAVLEAFKGAPRVDFRQMRSELGD